MKSATLQLKFTIVLTVQIDIQGISGFATDWLCISEQLENGALLKGALF